jgi:uncharacterized protein (TIGR03083 family)
MQLTPHYDGPPVFTIDGPADDQRAPLVRQRRRLQEALAGLDDEDWKRPSRCDGWTIQDVIAHLIGTNSFWSLSISAGLAGSPTRVLAAFDPVATPELMVASMRTMAPAETLGQFAETNASLFEVVEGLDDAGWSAIGESPAGHVTMRALAHHALWDSWVHERDVLVPLGIAPAEEVDELTSCLRYVAGIAPALARMTDSSRRGALAIDATDPDIHVVVEVGEAVAIRDGAAPDGAVRLTGRTVDLIDMLSIRAPLDQVIPTEGRWMFEGLATVFDTRIEYA